MAKDACSGCASAENCSGESCSTVQEPTKAQQASDIKHIIAVMSGKGGVGKSSMTSMLAVTLQKKGFRVGILDADVTGPSIPKMFGIKDKASGSEIGIVPCVSSTGIKIISLNLMMPQEDMPVVWRGPIISQLVGQFWSEVVWGELDYLLVDLPPGTGDVPISVFQGLPVSGVVTVSSPQQLAGMIVRKAINMLKLYKIKNFGLIENMAYYECPDCGKRVEIFGKPSGEEEAKMVEIPFLGELPLDSKLTSLADVGKIETYSSNLFDVVVDKIITQVEEADVQASENEEKEE